MLVLSRNEGDGITLPELGVAVEILKIQGNRVQVGVHASKDICILRSELVDRSPQSVEYADRSLEKELRQRITSASVAVAMARTQLEHGNWAKAEQALCDLASQLEASKKIRSQAQSVSECTPSYDRNPRGLASDRPKRSCLVSDANVPLEGIAC